MNHKITGQPGFESCTKGATRGEMNPILPDVKRAGALPGSPQGRAIKSRSHWCARTVGILSLAAMACAGYAQDEQSAKEPVEAQASSPAKDVLPAVAPQNQTADAPAAPGEESSSDSVSGNVGIVVSNTPIERVLQQLTDQSGVTISARGKTPGTKVTLIQPKKVPLHDALNQLVNNQPNWLLYEPQDNPGTYEIWDQETYKTEVLPRLVRPKVFLPKEITAEEAAKALEGVMTPGIGKVAFDPRSNKVIMTDLVPVLELAQRLLETIDVKFYTRVYYIEHADVNAVAEKLSALKSPAAPDVQTDDRTRQIIVSDRIDILQKMEQIVETLDVGPEMRVYTINNLGVDGEDLEELETAIEEILTPDAYYHFNVRQGKLIVRDLPEVQDRVEKVLAAFDAPIKQILLQLEIIETEFSDGFNWSVDYAFSADLLAAVTDGLVSGIPNGSVSGVGGKPVEGSEGFVNFRKEFPVVQGGSTGLNAQLLTKSAFVKLSTVMSDSRTRVLQQPRILVENQKIASFDVGQSVPFLTGGSIGVSSNGNTNNLTPSQPVQQLLQVGLYVEVQPIISGNGLIELVLTVENSSPLIRDLVFNGALFTGVGKTNQTLETTMWVPSGQTRVIGGLVTDSKSESKSGIPGLIKIPILGPALFGSYSRSPEDNRRRNLLIFVTPTIVEESPSDMGKYKGVLVADMPQDALTTPSATITDLPMSNFSNLQQLEKGDHIPNEAPPVPDFEAMSRSLDSNEQVLLHPTDIPPSLSATVNLETNAQTDLLAPDPSGLTSLPRMNLVEQVSTDTLSSLIPVAGPSGLMTSGSKNLVKPPVKATPPPNAQAAQQAAAAARAAQAAAAAQQQAGQPGAPGAPGAPPPVATPPSRETAIQ